MNRSRRWGKAVPVALALVCLLSFLYSPSAGQQQAKAKKIAAVEGITEYKLDNGFRYLLLPDPAAANVVINMTVLVGSRHEGFGESGMAHLLEHMLFKGSKGFLSPDKALQAHGAGTKKKGYNGTTNIDRTNYYEILPGTDENLKFGIQFEADRLVNSFVKKEDLDKEMTVVRNEFENGENAPGYILGQRIFSAAFQWHNYGKSTIGNKSDIERVPIANLKEFYKKYYQPDNAVLVVAGKFDVKKAQDYIAKYFGAIPKPERELIKTYTQEPPQDGEREVILRRTGKLPLVGVAYHSPAAADPDNAAMDVVSEVFTAEPAGRLYKALVETKKAVGVGGYNPSWHDPSLIVFIAAVAPGSTPEEVRDIMIKEIENVAKNPITDDEVKRAKKALLSNMDQLLANTEALATNLSEWLGAGDWRLLFLHRDRTADMTTKHVNEAAKKFLVKSSRTVGLFYPTDAKDIVRADVPTTPDIEALVKNYKGKKELAKGEEFDPTPENLEKRTQRTEVAPGLKVAMLPKKTTGETVVATMVLRFGNEKSLKGHTTAAGLIGTMLERGTKKYTRQQLIDELDSLGASLSVSTTAGRLNVGIQAKRKTLPAVLDLLEEVLRHPTFPEKEFDILKAAALEGIKSKELEPGTLAGNKLQRTLNPYPKDSIHYVPTIKESIERLEKTTLDQVTKIYHEQIGASHGQMAIVGDFDPETTLTRVKAIVDGWKSKTSYERIPLKAHTEVAGAKFAIETPDKKGAVYLAGLQLAIKESDPKYAAMDLANFVLGGSGFTSMLTAEIRKDKGLAYSVGSRFSASDLDDYAFFYISATCNPENMGKVEMGVDHVIATALKKGVGEEEFEAARKSWLEQEKLRRSGDGDVASMMVSDLYLGRTFTYYTELESKIAKVTLKEVNEAMHELLLTKRLVIVRAGDFKKAEK